MSTKLLFSDIDGTLLQSDNTLSPGVRRLLCEMAAKGHGMILSSGRPLDSIVKVKDYIDIPFRHSYIIANNGALVYDCNARESILETRFPLELINPVQKLADEMGLHVQTYTNDSIVVEMIDPEILHYTQKIKLPVLTSINLAEALTIAPFKMLAIDLDGSQKLKAFQKAIHDKFGDHIQTLFSNPCYLELIDKNASKGNALRYLCEHLSIDITDSIAAGDSENDIPMLKAAGLGVAMLNADDIVKENSDIVTSADHNHDGLCEIIQNYILNPTN